MSIYSRVVRITVVPEVDSWNQNEMSNPVPPSAVQKGQFIILRADGNIATADYNEEDRCIVYTMSCGETCRIPDVPAVWDCLGILIGFNSLEDRQEYCVLPFAKPCELKPYTDVVVKQQGASIAHVAHDVSERFPLNRFTNGLRGNCVMFKAVYEPPYSKATYLPVVWDHQPATLRPEAAYGGLNPCNELSDNTIYTELTMYRQED